MKKIITICLLLFIANNLTAQIDKPLNELSIKELEKEAKNNPEAQMLILTLVIWQNMQKQETPIGLDQIVGTPFLSREEAEEKECIKELENHDFSIILMDNFLITCLN
jgi:hypothetical protein